MIPTKVFHPVNGSSGSVTGATPVRLPIVPPSLNATLSCRIRVTWRSGPGYIAFGPTSAATVVDAAHQIDLPGASGSEIFDLGSDQLFIAATAGFSVGFTMEY